MMSRDGGWSHTHLVHNMVVVVVVVVVVVIIIIIIYWVKVFGHFQAVESSSIGIELGCLKWFFGIEGRSPVIKQPSSIY